MNKEQEALALKVAKEAFDPDAFGMPPDILWNELVDYASRFLDAIRAQQEPVAYLHKRSDQVRWPIQGPVSGWFPVFAFPPAIPEGMVLVPRELTLEMYEACCCSMDRGFAFEYIRIAYKDMIAAAAQEGT